ncbi:MAG: MaoC/PaaZ C-terminal domain-containing protein [Rhodoglobus sp.]
MALNLEAIGQETDGGVVSWTSKDAILYALGVGAGSADPSRELEFTTENSAGVTQRLLPTFPVVLGGQSSLNLGDFSMAQVLHAEQSVETFAELPVEGTLRVTSRVEAVHDKGEDALILVSAEFRDDDAVLLARTTSTIFVRGEGGFGGERGESVTWERPDREPDASIVYETRKDQALIYRLSGDRNPLHSDPAFAAKAGFPQPILHGLCGYGFTGRALLTLVDNDPARFGLMSARFSSPVLPGDSLQVNTWRVGGGSHLFEVLSSGRPVLTRGIFEERK